VGIRDQLRSLRRQANEDLDYLTLNHGSRYYFDPQTDPAELFFEIHHKSYFSSEVETPEIRKALAQATPESLARFEKKYQLPLTKEVSLVGFPDKGQLIMRRIELDGTVRTFLVEGEAAKEQRADSRTGRRERKPLDLSREDVHEITSEEERKLLEVKDLSE
jgi:hypothetical protein